MASTLSAAWATCSSKIRSIQFQLSLRFFLLALVAIAIAGWIVWTRLHHLDDIVQEVALRHQVLELTEHLSVDAEGIPRLDMDDELVRHYDVAHGGSVFLIRDRFGTPLFSSSPNARRFLEPGLLFPEDIVYFDASAGNLSAAEQLDPIRFGATERVTVGGQEFLISVAQHKVTDEILIHAVAHELLDDVLSVAAPLLAIYVLASFGAIRMSLRGLSSLSRRAAGIGPKTRKHRLPLEHAPAEVRPLAKAMNRALDKLDAAYEAQRQFNADAAHQLQTPLAILSARVSAMELFVGADMLNADVERMRRLVRQLLSSARAGSVEIDLEDSFDLATVAREVVASLAPVAIKNKRDIEVIGGDGEIVVAGNVALAFEAISNLVDNAVAHTPEGTTVSVILMPPNRITVADCGRGVPAAERHQIFQHFRQGAEATTGGAGLGLAIVADVMRAHDGAVVLEDREQGGAAFTLEFREARQARPSETVLAPVYAVRHA